MRATNENRYHLAAAIRSATLRIIISRNVRDCQSESQEFDYIVPHGTLSIKCGIRPLLRHHAGCDRDEDVSDCASDQIITRGTYI